MNSRAETSVLKPLNYGATDTTPSAARSKPLLESGAETSS
jgi:hypothetical protein